MKNLYIIVNTTKIKTEHYQPLKNAKLDHITHRAKTAHWLTRIREL